jgi:hypothetical protein
MLYLPSREAAGAGGYLDPLEGTEKRVLKLLGEACNQAA